MVASTHETWAALPAAASGSALSLKVPEGASLLPRLVASLCTSSGGIPADRLALEDVATAGQASITSEATSVTISGDLAVARGLVTASRPDIAARLLGATPVARAQVNQWLMGVHSGVGALASPGLPRLRLLNSLLASQPALASLDGSITLADVAVYAGVVEDVSALPLFDRHAMPHLMRWIDLVQTTTGARQVSPSTVPVKPAPFQPPSLAKGS